MSSAAGASSRESVTTGVTPATGRGDVAVAAAGEEAAAAVAAAVATEAARSAAVSAVGSRGGVEPRPSEALKNLRNIL